MLYYFSRVYHDDLNPYAPGGRARRPSGPTSGLPHSPAPTGGPPNGFFNSTPIPHSPRVNGYAIKANCSKPMHFASLQN